MPEKRIFSRFKAFLSLGGIIYHIGKENGLNRKFEKNNSRNKTGQKKSKKSTIFFVLEISKLSYISKNFEKKRLQVSKKVVNLQRQTN